MNEECLKLTTYFGEQDRTGQSLLATTLLDLYERHQLRTCLMLRGIEGFGRSHRLHNDLYVDLSSDLPVVTVAVDTRQKIDALLPEVLAIKDRGLLTIERARLLADLTNVALPPELDEATKLTVYVGRQDQAGGTAAFKTVCSLLRSHGISGATVLLGVDGTIHGERQRATMFGRRADVPTMIVCVGTGSEIGAALPELGEILVDPIVTLERVRICKRDGQLIASPHELPSTDEHGLPLFQKLMIHSSESDHHHRRPLHHVLVERLRMSDGAGATSIRGIWGFQGGQSPHGDKLLQLHPHTPVLTTIVDTPDQIAKAFEIVDAVTEHAGLVTSEMVPTARTVSAGEVSGAARLARHRF